MPTGKARIIGDIGEIDTDAPTPVTFFASDFCTVVDGDVYFERREDDLTKAKLVRMATAADHLMMLAMPTPGLTRPATKLMHEHVSELLSQHTKARSRKVQPEEPEAHMKRLGKMLSVETKRVGVAALRRGIAEAKS